MGSNLLAFPKAFVGAVTFILFSSGTLFSQQTINIDAPKIFSPSPQSESLHAVVKLPQHGQPAQSELIRALDK